MENNLAETAFVNLNTYPYELRWFTPMTEVDLCGHATLATSRVLFDEYLAKDEHLVRLHIGLEDPISITIKYFLISQEMYQNLSR